ncbi:fatty acid CoA ligase family protein [Synoicihabitans lomoniglobus]|uniref:Fatty acid CoA ligase family protein n=1 Tax=Synoicihabitans lomoniglobus TaxID=2909285 RepID=A0AAF0A0V1_9BACT|nr:AMP-binding protein [Opitutaceae bacterium LMO-M01]WED64507.1 fatty acid CoA ligase family protein [Opitutaceae bacterium LMO-M01]
MSAAAASANIARHLPRMAAAQPATPALKIPRGRTADGSIDYLTLSFAELEAEAAAWQSVLTQHGVQRGDRVLVMVRQGLPLIASVFALFAQGAVPVVIDPGMGRKTFLRCVERTQPRVLLGIPLARVLSHVFRGSFKSVQVRIAASGSSTARCPAKSAPTKLNVVTSATDELAAILFTSGSTGAPKGVCYEHGMFNGQVELIRQTYDIQPGEIDLPMLPIFALFNPALGMTTVVPEIDPSKPAAVDPAKILQAITQEKITNSFGSPTLWLKIARHCHRERRTLDSMKRVLSAGAPVSPELWGLMGPLLPHGELHSPYGATEALPVSSIAASSVLAETAAQTLTGAGTCVGSIIAGNTVKIIALTDGPIATLADATELPPGEIGEIIITGPTATQAYDALPEATARAKIATGNPHQPNPKPSPKPLGFERSNIGTSGASAPAWHRMGDCGYLDAKGRLWFCGRAAERVETAAGPLFTEQVEPLFNQHPRIRRSALIGHGRRPQQRAAIVIEPRDPDLLRSTKRCRELGRELRELTRDHPYAGRVTLFYFHPGFPVDVRHNAKIHRLTLTDWAETEATGFEVDPKK